MQEEVREVAPARDLRERLRRMSEASLRINENLDFDSVLREVVDSARDLADARYGCIITLHESGKTQEFVSSGLSPDEHKRLADLPANQELFGHFKGTARSIRLRDFYDLPRSIGFPDFRLPAPLDVHQSFLMAPMLHGGERVGVIYLTQKKTAEEFSPEDEETLVMFASQAALVIANARRHQDEQKARTDLEALVDISPVGVMVVNALNGEIVSMNREVKRIVSGLRDSARTMEDLWDIVSVHRSDGQRIPLRDWALPHMMQPGHTIRAEEITLEAPDGSSVSVLINATSIPSATGEVETIVVTLQDMTPLKELDSLRAEFLAMVSHELRTPLASIKGSTSTLMDPAAALTVAETSQFYRIIDGQADRMRGLIADLLDVAHIKTGALSVNPEALNVAELVEQARSTFVSAGSLQRVHVDVPADLPQVVADRQRVLQVLNNLLSNAAKHSPESSIIRVSAGQRDFDVTVTVTDEGRGMSSNLLPLLFQKFSRLEELNGKRIVDGTGLGLAICKGIVEAHGGRIWAESEGVGQGSRFTFSIPVADQRQWAPSPGRHLTPVHSPQAGEERVRILAVDDDPQMLRHVKDVLSREGYVPLVAGDAREAIRLLETGKPRLALLDFVLQDTDGLALMQQMHQITNLPVIFLSAYGRDMYIERAFEHGAADYVVKPFSPTELLARIKATLRKQAANEGDEIPGRFVLGDLALDYGERRVSLADKPIHLTPKEYDLLRVLSLNAGRAMSHDQLLLRVWGDRSFGGPQLLRTHLRTLRRKLGDNAKHPKYLLTEPGVGYRMTKANSNWPSAG